MAYETILFDVANGAARLTLNRPDRLNSFTVEMHREVAEALARVEKDGEIPAHCLSPARAAVSAPVRISRIARRAGCGGSRSRRIAREPLQSPDPAVDRIVETGRLRGERSGGGRRGPISHSPADIVLAAKSAKFIQSFSNIGLCRDSGGTWILPRLAGHARALGLALTGEPLGAEKAESWGLIWRAVDDDQLAAKPGNSSSASRADPRGATPRSRWRCARAGSPASTNNFDLERDLQRELGRSDDYREGVTAFTEKRKPNFTGR